MAFARGLANVPYFRAASPLPVGGRRTEKGQPAEAAALCVAADRLSPNFLHALLHLQETEADPSVPGSVDAVCR